MAWIVALAGAAASAYSANKQAKSADKASGQMNELYGVQANNAKALSPYATDYFKKSQEAYAPAFAYYSSLASGDRSRMLSAVAPELKAIGGKYGSLVSATRELSPRGGASASYMTDLAFRSADEQQAYVNQQRVQAIANLVQMAGLAGNLGASAAGTSSSAASSASGLLANVYGMQSGAAANQAASYAQLGEALAGMFGQDTQGWYVGKQRGRG